MQIYFDNIIFSLQKAGGISVYWFELIQRLLRDQHPIIFAESSKNSQNVFYRQLQLPKQQVILDSKIPLQLSRYLPIQIKLSDNSIFHSSYYRISRQKNIIQFTTVYDFIYEKMRKGPATWVHHWQKTQAILHANKIICISENTKNDLLQYYPQVLPENIHVIYIAASEEFHLLKNIEEKNFLSQMENQLATEIEEICPSKFVLYVGDRSYYKNFPLAVEAVSKIPNLKLIAVGGKELSKEEQIFIQKKLPQRFIRLTGIDTKTLNYLYNHAFALLYPSTYEGFGLPVLEAMQAACPVLAIHTSSIPEIAGKSCFLAPNNMEQHDTIEYFCQSLQKLYDPKVRQEYINKGLLEAQRFSWEKCYQETYNLYQRAYNHIK